MKISKNCYAVTGLGALAPWYVNAGVVVGETQTLVVDTGATWAGAQTLFGYASVIRPKNTISVFNCEPHFDHIGGNSFFAEQGCGLYGHPEIDRNDGQFVGEVDEFNQSIVEGVRAEAGEGSVFYRGVRVVNPEHAAAAGFVFELGGVSADVVALPGHTAINQGIWVKDEGVLFSADCIVSDYIPNLLAGGMLEWRQWLTSLDFIEGLGAEVVVPGHGRVLRGVEIGAEISRIRRVVEAAIERGAAPGSELD